MEILWQFLIIKTITKLTSEFWAEQHVILSEWYATGKQSHLTTQQHPFLEYILKIPLLIIIIIILRSTVDNFLFNFLATKNSPNLFLELPFLTFCKKIITKKGGLKDL